MTIKLVGLDDLNPSAYNPRTADPKRLDIIELSLRKLGFVLRMSQCRYPHRSDVYLIKFQNEEPREVDERWLESAPNLS